MIQGKGEGEPNSSFFISISCQFPTLGINLVNRNKAYYIALLHEQQIGEKKFPSNES